MNDETHAVKESPLACDMSAIEPCERTRHIANAGELFRAVEEIRGVPGGYAFRLPNEAVLQESLAKL